INGQLCHQHFDSGSLQTLSKYLKDIWYTPGWYHGPATGFLEERLHIIKKRLRSISRSWSMAHTPPQWCSCKSA
ncbi:hypothetical protein CHARACLAT_025149, partial [Characodon lateralis]|nr:hypothetical protein [Characodon lateralis]